MRLIKGFSAAFALAMASAAVVIPGIGNLTNFIMPNRDYRLRGRSKRIRMGKAYPHSSTRQRARYARQIAAGQLQMEGVNNG